MTPCTIPNINEGLIGWFLIERMTISIPESLVSSNPLFECSPSQSAFEHRGSDFMDKQPLAIHFQYRNEIFVLCE